MVKIRRQCIQAYKTGTEKARLERMSEGGPDIGGCGPEFLDWVKDVYAPYNDCRDRARKIVAPEGFLVRRLFELGYQLEKTA